MSKAKHILASSQFSKSDLLEIFKSASEMKAVIEGGACEVMKGKIMATLFFEPSTRTRFSFETAMLRLGGSVISNADMMTTSSTKKRETLFDTGKVVSKMADIIVMRHPEGGAVTKLAEGSEVPVINAGDGAFDHPTQGLLDMYTIWKEFGQIDNLCVCMVGDLKHSRVFHSQCEYLKHFPVKILLVSPEELRLPETIKMDLSHNGIDFTELTDLREVISEVDVLSTTRIQEERFESVGDAERFRNMYRVDSELLSLAKKEMIVLNPLPRVDELLPEVDGDRRAKYFEQVSNGVEVRMALIKQLIG